MAPSVLGYTQAHHERPTTGKEINLKHEWTEDIKDATEAKQTASQQIGTRIES